MDQQTDTAAQHADSAQLVERLVAFDGPPERFLQELLRTQCRVGSAERGALFRATQQGQLEAVAVEPPVDDSSTPPVWLAQAAELAPSAMRTGATEVHPLRAPDELYGAEPSRRLILVPLRAEGGMVRGVGAFVIDSAGGAAVRQRRDRLELTVPLLSMYEMRLTLQQRGADLQRLRRACQVLVSINQHTRFGAASMALCNELASRFGCDRVTFGLLRGRQVKAQAMSHTEKLSRKMELVRAVESAMEECIDQDTEVTHPADEGAETIHRAAGELATRYGPSAVLSLPVRWGGEPVGVITLERAVDRPFEAEEIEVLRLAGDLSGARLAELAERDRWFGAKLARSIRTALAAAVGPRHTWAKAAAVAVAVLLGVAIFGEGTYKVSAPFTIEASRQQVVAAPFAGYIDAVEVEPGDRVTAGQTVLAKLDDAQLRLDLAEAMAERRSHETEAQIARREDKIAEARMAEAKAQRAAARADLLRWRIEHSVLRSPIDGVVVSGDLKKELGGPVDQGEKLFEVAPIDALRAELSVPEDRIADLEVGQTGKLASKAQPGDYVPYRITKIEPVAQVVEQRNIFTVRAKLLEERARFRPGMKGVAKTEVGQRTYGWIWTHELIEWIRMKLWI